MLLPWDSLTITVLYSLSFTTALPMLSLSNVKDTVIANPDPRAPIEARYATTTAKDDKEKRDCISNYDCDYSGSDSDDDDLLRP